MINSSAKLTSTIAAALVALSSFALAADNSGKATNNEKDNKCADGAQSNNGENCTTEQNQ